MVRSQFEVHMPTIAEIHIARTIYQNEYPGDIYYVAALGLVNSSVNRDDAKGIAVGLAVLLLNWNSEYYFRWHPNLLKDRYTSQEHLFDIERVVTKCLQVCKDYRKLNIINLSSSEHERDLKEVFEVFRQILGPVGAAKSMHLLAPLFFPLWDNSIAKNGYGIDLVNSSAQAKANLYCRFMNKVKMQCAGLDTEKSIANSLLKAIDEYNFITYTRQLI